MTKAQGGALPSGDWGLVIGHSLVIDPWSLLIQRRTPAGPFDEACAIAHVLLGHWQVPGRESLQQWQETRRRSMPLHGPGGHRLAQRPRPPAAAIPRCGIALRTTHRSDTPWCVQWSVLLAGPGSAAAAS